MKGIDFKELIETKQAEKGWTDETLLGVLKDFIHEHGQLFSNFAFVVCLEEYLEKR